MMGQGRQAGKGLFYFWIDHYWHEAYRFKEDYESCLAEQEKYFPRHLRYFSLIILWLDHALPFKSCFWHAVLFKYQVPTKWEFWHSAVYWAGYICYICSGVIHDGYLITIQAQSACSNINIDALKSYWTLSRPHLATTRLATQMINVSALMRW